MRSDFIKWILYSICFSFFYVQALLAVPDRTNNLVLVPSVGYCQFSHKWDMTSHQTTPVFSIGYGFNHRLNIEFLLTYLSAEQKKDNGHDINGSFYLVDGLYYFRTQKSFQPYLLGGIGLTNLHPHAENDLSLQSNLNFGMGLESFFSDRVALRVDVRDIYTVIGGKHDILINGGVVFLFKN